MNPNPTPGRFTQHSISHLHFPHARALTDGRILAKHRKVHLFDIDVPGKITFKESDTLTGGDGITVVDCALAGGFKIGVGICYDIRFPEVGASFGRLVRSVELAPLSRGPVGYLVPPACICIPIPIPTPLDRAAPHTHSSP